MEPGGVTRPGVTCEHLNRVVSSLSSGLWTYKEWLECLECDCSGPNLWLCLQPDCGHVGCSELNNDHSTQHQKSMPSHCVHINLSTDRIWCYACEREVHMRAALSLPKIQACEAASIGGWGAGAGPPELARSAGLNVAAGDDDEDAEPPPDADRRPQGLVGLQNMGNTCYMNAALQALSNTRPLTEYFLDCSAVAVLAQNKKPALSRAYQKLVREMWSKKTRGSVVPSGILYGMRGVQPMFRGYHQHDAQEFLRCFMQQLHEELKEAVTGECGAVRAGDAEGDRRGATAAGGTLAQARHRTASAAGSESPKFYRVRRKSPALSTRSESRADGYLRMHALSESEGLEQARVNRHRRSASFAGVQQAAFAGRASASEAARAAGSESELSCDSETEERYETCSSGGASDTAAPHSDRDGQTEAAGGCGGGDGVRYRSVISDVFDGQLLSSVQCLICDRVSTRVETFQDLSLPIPSREHIAVLRSQQAPPHRAPGPPAHPAHDSWMWWLVGWVRSWFYGPVVSLQDCLAAFFTADELKGDNMYSCSRCNKLRNGVKMSGVVRLPEVLCVHLKRFRHELMFSAKVGARVSFPLHNLNMAPYLHKECTSAVHTYELCAVISHAGTAGGGHYTCVARNSRAWYEFDDQCVTRLPRHAVAAAEAYVLFYRKVNPHMAELRARAAEILAADSSEPSDMKFYISKQWIIKFNTWAEPGAIDNSDFVCRHGGVRPERAPHVHLLAAVVSQRLWEFLHHTFGGGPACTHVHECSTCARAAERLRARRARELRSFYELHAIFQEQEDPTAVYAISMRWFRQWQAFVRDKTQQPPPPVDNTVIVTKQESLDPSAPPTFALKQGSDHAQLSEELWRFFVDIYGGGPEVKLKSPASVEPASQPQESRPARTPSADDVHCESDREDRRPKSVSDANIHRSHESVPSKTTQSLQNIDRRYRTVSARASTDSEEEVRTRTRRARRVSHRENGTGGSDDDASPPRRVPNGVDSDRGERPSDGEPRGAAVAETIAMETEELPDLDSISLKCKKSGKVRRARRRTVK